MGKPVDYREIKLLEGIETEVCMGKQRYQFKEIQDSLKDYMRKGREIVNRIRC